MFAVLLVTWIIALGGDAVGSGIVARRLFRLRLKRGDMWVPVRSAQLLAWVMFGSSFEATAVLVSLFVSQPKYAGAISALAVRLAARIVKAALLIPYVADAGMREASGE